MKRCTFDTRRAEAFAEEMLGVLNGGALTLMLSVGHRCGLFDVMAGLPASTPEAIAEEAGLHARYVREWLAAMVAGGVVELDAADGTYRLPTEHAAVLTRSAASRNLAASAQWIPVLGSVEDRALGCFERGGGIARAAFGRLEAVRAEQSERHVARDLIGAVLPRVPGLAEALRRGIDVLDVGCGSGRALQHLARAFPRSRFRGIDLSPEAIDAARAAGSGLANASFELRDPAELRERESCDLVTALGCVPAQARPEAVLASAFRALRPQGRLVLQDAGGTGDVARDADHPLAPFFYTLSCLYTVSVSLAAHGAGVGAMWGRMRLVEALSRAGFAEPLALDAPGDLEHVYYVARRPI